MDKQTQSTTTLQSSTVRTFAFTAVGMGAPFGLVMGLFFSFMSTWRVGLVGGVLSGIAFGMAMAAFMTSQRRRFRHERPEFTDEVVLHEGPANHFHNWEGVGGWLYLTPRRLLFRSHKFNIQPHETEIPLHDISAATPVLTARLIPNGLRVTVESGGHETFVVNGRRDWSKAITEAKKEVAQQENGNA